MQALRDALGQAGDGHGLNQTAGAIDRIEGEDRQVTIVFGAIGAPRKPAARFSKSWRTTSPRCLS